MLLYSTIARQIPQRVTKPGKRIVIGNCALYPKRTLTEARVRKYVYDRRSDVDFGTRASPEQTPARRILHHGHVEELVYVRSEANHRLPSTIA